MKNKKSPEIEPRHLMITFLVLFMIGAAVLTAPKRSSQPVKGVAPTPPPATATVTGQAAPAVPTNAVPYTEAEMHQFWDKHLKQLIEAQWMNKTLPYAEVNDRLISIREKLVSNTGNDLVVRLCTTYHDLSKIITGAAGFETNQVNSNLQARVVLFIPAIIDYYNRNKAKYGVTDEAFPISVLAVTMHEAEHLISTRKEIGKIDITEESRAWLETCKYTLAPLVEKYNAQLFDADLAFYNAWVADNRQRGRTWSDNLYRFYGPLAVIRENQRKN